MDFCLHWGYTQTHTQTYVLEMKTELYTMLVNRNNYNKCIIQDKKL